MLFISFCLKPGIVSKERKTRSELKREAIIEAARAAFQAHGVQQTSMDMIAEQAKVSKRTVYNNFATKEDLVAYLLSDLWRMAMVDLDSQYDSNQELLPQLQTLLLEEISLISGREYIELSRMAFGHYLYRTEELLQAMESFNSEDTAIHAWLEQAREDNRLGADMDLEFAYQQLHGLVKAAAFWPQFMGTSAELEEKQQSQLASETAKMFLARYSVGD